MRTLIRAVGAVALARVLFLPAAPLYAQAPNPAYSHRAPAEDARRSSPADSRRRKSTSSRCSIVAIAPTWCAPIRPCPASSCPVTWLEDPLAYSPFPRTWPAAEPHAKAIVVHQAMQAFGAYEGGRLVRWGPVSTGRRETPTPEGAFNLTWRARSRRSTDNEDWLLEWYFNFVNERGVSFHLFDLPGLSRQPRVRAAAASRCAVAVRVGRAVESRRQPA